MENVIRMQFNLKKHANMDIIESELLSYLDFDIYYSLLVKDIQEQNESMKGK